MKTRILLASIQFPLGTEVSENHMSYVIGGIIALLLMGYLIYVLLRPDKF